MRRRLSALALLAAGLGVLLGLGLFPQGPLRRLAESRLARALGGTVSIGRLQVVPLRLSLDIQDLVLDTPTLRGRIDRVRLVSRSRALLGDTLALRLLAAEGVNLEARLAEPSADGPAPRLPPLQVEEIEVQGALRLRGPSLGGDLDLTGLRVSGAVGADTLTAEIGAWSWSGQGRSLTGGFRTRLRIAPDLDTTVVDGRLSTSRSRIDFSGPLGTLAAPQPDLGFEAELDAGEVAAGVDAGPVRGTLRATGQVRGAEPFAWSLDLESQALDVSGITLAGLKGQASGTGAATSGRLELDALGGRVLASARLDGDTLDARVAAANVRVETLRGYLGGVPAAGPVTAKLTLRGGLSKLATDLVLDAPDLRLRDAPASALAEARGNVDALTGEVRLDWLVRGQTQLDLAAGPGVRIASARFEAAGTARGTAPPNVAGHATGELVMAAPGAEVPPLRFELDYTGRATEITSLSARLHEVSLGGLLPEAAGTAQLRLEARGPLARLSGSLGLEARDLAWRQIPLGGLQLEAESRSGDWTVRADLAQHALRLEARSPFPERGERRVSGTLAFEDSALQPLASLLPDTMPEDGRLNGRITFEGSVAQPAALSLRSDLRLAGSGLTVSLDGSAGVLPDSPLDLHLAAQADIAAFDASPEINSAGTLDLDVRFAGTRLAPLTSGEARASGVSVAGKGLPEITIADAQVAFDGAAAELRPAALSLAGGEITLSGRLPLSAAEDARVSLEWSGLAAEQLLRPFAGDEGKGAPLLARLSGRAELTGQGYDPFAWRGEASITAEKVKAAEVGIELTPLQLRLDRGLVEAAPVTLRSGPGSLTLEGRFDLPNRRLALAGKGALDLRALSPLVGAASLTGLAEIDLSADGSFDAPQPRGSLVLRDAAIRLRDIPEALTGLGARLAFDGSVLRLEDARGNLGGGEVTASGQGTLKGATLEELQVEIRGRDLALRYPAGLRSRLDADLVLERQGQGFLLAGDVKLLRGLYDLDVAIQETVKAPTVKPQPSPLLRSVSLDLRVVLESPVLIRNKLANLDIDGNLQFRGDLEAPAPFGRLDIATGGKIYLGGRDFAVESGRLSYGGDWDPPVSLRATRRLRDASDLVEHDVQLVAEGPLSTVQPVLRSEGLTDSQVISLVATGRTTGSGSAVGARVAGQQAAALALGELSQGLGLGEVNVQPELLARETDPGTRFTIGKQLTPILSFIYSLSLQGPEQRFVQVEATLPRGFSLKAQRADDGVFAVGAGQRLRLGGVRKTPASDDRIRLTEVRVDGELPDAARSALKAKAGKRVAAWDVQEDADRLRRRLTDLDYVEAQVGGRIENGAAVFRVQAGPLFAWRVEGMTSPPDLQRPFRDALYEEDAVDRARTLIVKTLRDRGFLRGRVSEVRPEPEAGKRTLVFVVETGPALEATVEFPGAERLSRQALLDAAGGPGALLTGPQDAIARVVEAYADAGRFGVEAGPVLAEEAAGRVSISVPVDEGDPPRIAGVQVEGATLSQEELDRVHRLAVGDPYSAEAVAAAVERVRDHYYSRGYPQMGVAVESELQGRDVVLRFEVREGERAVVGSVEIVGLKRTRESLVRRQLRVKPGDPLDPRRLGETERRLLDLGVFSQVQVTSSSGSPANVSIELAEKPLAEAAYDLRWSEETRGSLQLDAEVRHLLGLGLNLGGRYRFGADNRESRASLHLPSFRRGKFTVAAAQLEEDFDATDIFTGESFVNTQTERVIEFQQAVPVTRRTNVLAGYRFKSVFSTAFPIPIHVASLDLSGLRDTRDNPLDARSGQFLSLNFQLSPKLLGSDLTFVKGFGQLFLHRPLSPAWTWSQGLRLGLARGFGGQIVIPSERFRAGGSDSLRGFARNAVGPRDVLGEPSGGEAVLIVNQELRYRHGSGWGLALLWDFGNVFERVGDLGLDLRHDVGGGLRWASPVGLLRLDLAFPLARQAGENAYRLSFSLGQAF